MNLEPGAGVKRARSPSMSAGRGSYSVMNGGGEENNLYGSRETDRGDDADGGRFAKRSRMEGPEIIELY